MSKKKSSPSKNSTKKKKYTNAKKGISKKLWVALCAVALAVILTVVLVVVCNIEPTIDWEAAEANLRAEGYEIGSYVPELNGYNGFVKTMSATHTEQKSDSLADYINAEKETINFVQFDTEENASLAYEVFCSKWSDKYDKHGVVGDTVYFGTSDAFDIATSVEE